MPNLELDLRYLKIAILVADHGSFRRAAEATNVPQSTISRRISALEATLGTALFERTRTGARLTSAGEQFLHAAQVGSEQLRQAVRDLRQIRLGQSGVLSLGLTGSVGAAVLGDLLGRFRQATPQAQVRVREMGSDQGIAAVLDGRLDAALIVGTPNLSGCSIQPLWQERVLLAISSRNPLASRPSLTFKDVHEEIFVLRADALGLELEKFLLRSSSVHGFQPAVVTQDVGPQTLFNLVAAGMGITVTGTNCVTGDHPGVRFIQLDDDACRFTVSVVWRAANENPALKKFLRACDPDGGISRTRLTVNGPIGAISG